MAEKVTISLIKADVGAFVGHHRVHDKLLEVARETLKKAKEER